MLDELLVKIPMLFTMSIKNYKIQLPTIEITMLIRLI